MRELIMRSIDWFRRRRLERELAEELRFHHQRAERDAVAQGVRADESPWVARRRFGNRTHVMEQARERWSLPALDHLQQDVRYALRCLRRSPGFTATAVVTLALGIGANVAMFGVVDQLMFRPYAYLRDPGSVHRLYLRASVRGQESWDYCDQYTCYLDMRRYTTSFSELAGFASSTLAVGDGDAAVERPVGIVSASFWGFFDARPVRGRVFTAAEDSTPRGAPVSVLGYQFWQTAFGGRDVVGERLRVGTVETTIIGVMPQGFSGVFEPTTPDIYIPITMYAAMKRGNRPRLERYYNSYNWGWMSTMARRKPGVTVAQASADVSQAFGRSWLAQRALDPSLESLDRARPSGVVGPMKTAAGPEPDLEARTAVWLWGVAAVVLLIACANVANLSLARGLRRQRETAVRLALGVSRGRLVRQLLTESLVLAGLGGVTGVLVAQWGGTAIREMLITSGASLTPFIDLRVIVAVAVASLVAGLLAGTMPAAIAGRDDAATVLRAGHRATHQRTRLRAALLVAQAALSVLLLLGAALFVRSLDHVRDLRMGYDAEPVLLVAANARGTPMDTAHAWALSRALVRRAQEAPGVQGAASVTSVPVWSTSSMGLSVPGIDSVQRLGRFTYQITTPDFFRTFGTRILRGHGFTDADRAGAARVAVVSESMARVLWPGRDAIGQCMHVQEDTMPCTTVVGIAEDIVQKQAQLTDGRRYQYYLPQAQFGTLSGPSTLFMIRVTGDPGTQAEQLRRWLQPLMPGASYVTVQPLREMLASVRRSWELGARLFVAFGLLALVVAGIGLYGVLSYNVTQRFHELGVRVALGAQARDVVRLVVGQGARLVVVGVVVGSALALAAGRWIEPLLFKESAYDPAVYAVVAGVMLVVAVAASASPALRATSADPNEALRAE